MSNNLSFKQPCNDVYSVFQAVIPGWYIIPYLFVTISYMIGNVAFPSPWIMCPGWVLQSRTARPHHQEMRYCSKTSYGLSIKSKMLWELKINWFTFILVPKNRCIPTNTLPFKSFDCVRFVFWKNKMIPFIQQKPIQSIKRDIKGIYNVTKVFYFK